MRRLIARFAPGLRAQLVIAFVVVVAVALALVVATLPRLLDGYFHQQSTADLNLRANSVAQFVVGELVEYQRTGGASAQPILVPTTPISASDGVRAKLGTSDSGYVFNLAQVFAQSNIKVSIIADP